MICNGCTFCCKEQASVSVFQEEYDLLLRANERNPIKRRQFGKLHEINPSCPFRTEIGCSQYKLRPAACRAFPCDIRCFRNLPKKSFIGLNGNCPKVAALSKETEGRWGEALLDLGMTSDEFLKGVILRGYVLERRTLIVNALPAKQRKRYNKWEGQTFKVNEDEGTVKWALFPRPMSAPFNDFIKSMYDLYLEGGSEDRALQLLKERAPF